MSKTMPRILTLGAVAATVGVLATPAPAVEPPANASCLGQYVFFLAHTSDPNLGQEVVAPAATFAPGAVGDPVSTDATNRPHTYHC
jgi:hypothetical protein